MYGSKILILGSVEEAVICEKCREPNSYMVEIPATGQCFRRNSNFIKPRQSKQKPISAELQPTTVLPEIPQESPVLQQPAVPSSQATSTVDAIPTVPPLMQNRNSTPRTPRTPRQPEYPEEVPKEFHPQDLDYKSDISCTDILFQKGRCCDMGQNDTIGKIELNPSFILSSDNTNCKNDIQ